MDHEHVNHEAYLKGTMPPDERRAYETRLKEDAGLAREFEEFRAMHNMINLVGEHRLTARLAFIHEELNAESGGHEGARVIRMFPRRWLAIAASVVLAIAATYYFLGKSQSPGDLYAGHMTPYSGPDRTRSDGADPSDQWSRFAELYDAGRYDEALAGLDAVPGDRVPDYLVSFYRGQCLLLKQEPDPGASMVALEQVLATDNDLHAAAHWYIGLAALKAGDTALARSHFETLANAGDYRNEEAARILEELGDP